MYEISRKLSLAFWPRPELNESADCEAGNAAVDKLTLGELAAFFEECKAGPTYCMVARRVEEQLKKFPPHIDERKTQMKAAMDAAKSSLLALNDAYDYISAK